MLHTLIYYRTKWKLLSTSQGTALDFRRVAGEASAYAGGNGKGPTRAQGIALDFCRVVGKASAYACENGKALRAQSRAQP